MATKLYVRAKSGTQAIADLGITITTSWTLLASSGPSDPEGNSGQFTAREIRDSKDLWDLITGDTIEWSQDGSTVEAAGDYLGDFMLFQDFTDDFFDARNGRLAIPEGPELPVSGVEGEIFWDDNDEGLYLWDQHLPGWRLIATSSGVQTNHGLLDGLDDDDHTQYALLTGGLTRNIFSGGADFSTASGLILPTGTDRTGLATVEGNIMWDTDDDEPWFYDGTQWVSLATVISGLDTPVDHGTLAGLDDDDHTQYLTEARHDALASDNPHSVTFTQAVTADSGTDITAAEAETLTDGSNADGLHSHTASGLNLDHGELDGLADDDHPQYTNWDHDETISGVWTFATDTNEPALVITPDTAAPSTKLADGAIAIIDGLLSVYDSSRSKFLSVDRHKFVSGRHGRATNIYLRGPDGVPTSQTGFRMVRNGTIVGIWAQTEDNGNNWTAEVRDSAGSVLASLSVTSDGAEVTTTNVDVAQGDEIRVFCNGTAINAPLVGFEVAWRDT